MSSHNKWPNGDYDSVQAILHFIRIRLSSHDQQ